MKIRWRIRFLFWWYLNFRYDIKNEELFEIKKTGNGIKKLLFFLPLEKSDAQLANYFTKIPTKENTRIAFPGTFEMEKLPLPSVTVPCVVPLSKTVTPGKTIPSSPVTLPDIVLLCAKAPKVINNISKRVLSFFT